MLDFAMILDPSGNTPAGSFAMRYTSAYAYMY